MNNFSEKVNFIWSVADLFRGTYRPNQYNNNKGVYLLEFYGSLIKDVFL